MCIFEYCFFWDGLQLESESKHKLAECMMSNSAVVVHLHQKAKRKAKEEEYICVGGACSVCVSLTNFILGMPAMIEELPIDRS